VQKGPFHLKHSHHLPETSTVATCRGWGGPHDAGSYNSLAWETGFFVSSGGSWDSEYGRFFLGWYSQCLLDHADRVLGAAGKALAKKGIPRTFKSQSRVRLLAPPPPPRAIRRIHGLLEDWSRLCLSTLGTGGGVCSSRLGQGLLLGLQDQWPLVRCTSS